LIRPFPLFHQQFTPHELAFDNLLAACEKHANGQEGGCYANNQRGNTYINAWPFDSTISQRCFYENDGSFYSTEPVLLNSASINLGLNDIRLKLNRLLWRIVKQKGIQLEDVLSKNQETAWRPFLEDLESELVTSMTWETNPTILYQSVMNEGGWDSFLRYRYFYTYFEQDTLNFPEIPIK